ncbi:MAG: HEAT repeat domain-containing protein [Myxococcota bacterium]
MDEIRKISDIPNRIEDPDRAVAELKSWLTHDEREIREAAILALWDLESGSANQALADVARQEPDPELKGYAVEELVDREAPEAVEALLAVLDDEDADLREQAAEGLEELEDKGAIPALYKRLEVEQDEWVRDAILSALDTMDPDFDEEKYEE